MRIAVTGGSGLVGRRIVDHLSSTHEVSNLDLAPPPRSARGPRPTEHLRVDILNLTQLCRAIDGADAVVHAAGLPGPSFGTDEEIFNVNVEGTRNVALACERAGVLRTVFISSEAVLGFVFAGRRAAPHYFPIDEEHPLAASEPYGRSKLLAETVLSRQLTGDHVVVSLRPPWVWVPEEYDRCRRLTESPDDWRDGLWAYVHGDDLAVAAGLAATEPIAPGPYAVYVAAPDNGTVLATRELVTRHYPDVPVRGAVPEFGSLISSDAAERLLGFRPAMSWREFL
jgi:UDP-glucose 4-epimerase